MKYSKNINLLFLLVLVLVACSIFVAFVIHVDNKNSNDFIDNTKTDELETVTDLQTVNTSQNSHDFNNDGIEDIITLESYQPSNYTQMVTISISDEFNPNLYLPVKDKNGNILVFPSTVINKIDDTEYLFSDKVMNYWIYSFDESSANSEYTASQIETGKLVYDSENGVTVRKPYQ